MFDSPATSKIPKEELDKLMSGEVDYFDKYHEPIPAIIFDPITNNQYKTLQLSDLPLEITSRMNIPVHKDMDKLTSTDLYSIVNTDLRIQCEQIIYYLDYNIRENFIYQMVYVVFNDLADDIHIEQVRTFFDQARCSINGIHRIIDSIFSSYNILDTIPAKIVDEHDNMSKDLQEAFSRRFARADITANQLTSLYGTIICKAANDFIDAVIMPEVIRYREDGVYGPADIIKNINSKENKKLVEESLVAHTVAIKNYARIALDDFIMDIVHQICSWALSNSMNTLYYASYDYLHNMHEK